MSLATLRCARGIPDFFGGNSTGRPESASVATVRAARYIADFFWNCRYKKIIGARWAERCVANTQCARCAPLQKAVTMLREERCFE